MNPTNGKWMSADLIVHGRASSRRVTFDLLTQPASGTSGYLAQDVRVSRDHAKSLHCSRKRLSWSSQRQHGPGPGSGEGGTKLTSRQMRTRR